MLGTQDIEYVAVSAPDVHQADRLRWPQGPSALRLTQIMREGDEYARRKDWTNRHVPRQVAADVVRFLTSGAEIQDDDGSWRAVQPRDVAVLTRTNAQAQAVQEALQAAGVHAVATGGGSVFDSAEAVTLQRVLDGLLHPHRERDAKAAVITPLFGVDATTLVTMDEREWERRLEQLATWSQIWREHGVAEAMRRILDDGGRARLLTLRAGERRLTNLLHLLELLHDAERRGRLGPTALAAWLRDRRHDPRKDRDATELRLESDEDAATIVTIHRAKGLEYPVVWCPYLWEQSSLFDSELPSLRFHDPADEDRLTLDLHVKHDRPPKDAHKAQAKQETWQERLRLLYVALTRAEHHCTVYFGALTGYGKSPLGHVLHGLAGVTDKYLPSDAELAGRVADLAASADGRITVATADLPDEVPGYPPPASQDGELAARERTQSLDRVWGRTSFSALASGDHPAVTSEATDLRDVDAGTEHEPPMDTGGDADQQEPDVPLAAFPRGAAAGIFLHEVLERFDFTRADEPGELETLVADQLRRHRFVGQDAGAVADGLRAALHTPLGGLAGDVPLAEVAYSHRLNELRFDLPLLGGDAAGRGRSVDVRRLAAVFDHHADGLPILADAAQAMRRLDRHAVRGFLTGSIDLVFRRSVGGRPRYFVADYKSNWHGDRGAEPGSDRSTVSHYRPDVLGEAMVAHHYLLQAHLYLVALHRFLRWRLGGGYRYERDVGGVLYLFLRGMVGPATPATADGGRHGVYAWRPPAALVEDLDRLLGGEASA